jgi:hypothetical protein
MADKQTELLELLRRLQAQLRETRELDPAVAQQVEAVVHEIEATLPNISSPDAQEEAPLVDRLRQSALDFEASHPVLARTVGNIADTLAQMGI